MGYHKHSFPALDPKAGENKDASGKSEYTYHSKDNFATYYEENFKMSQWKITKLGLSLRRDNKRPGEIASIHQTYKEADITPTLLEDMRSLLLQGKITRVEIDNETEYTGMSIFIEGQKSQIGIVDEMNEVVYYYSNGSQSQKPVDIGGSTFEEWMICNQPETMLSILLKFIESGERLDTVLWVSEEI